MITKFTKSIIATAFVILGIAYTLPANTPKNIEVQMYEINNSAATGDAYCGVSEQEITAYLNMFGYHVAKIEEITGCCNALCKTIDNKKVVVYIVEGQIIGHDEIII